MEDLEVSSQPLSDEIHQVERILPSDQDRSLKIQSVISPDIRIFEYSDFIITNKLIGDGSYGQVFPATIKSSGKEVVLKRYREYDPKNIIDEYIIKEIALLQFLNKYPDTKTAFFFGIVFSPRGKIYLVLESLEISLGELLSKNTFPPYQLRILFYQLILAFYNIHGLGVIHNDIKLGNLMINNGDIRIIDFGLSEYLGVGPSTDLVSGYQTTPYYFAPDTPYYIGSDNKKQVLFGYLPNNRKSYASDMYSIGVTLVHAVLKRIVQLKVVDDNIHEVTLKEGIFIQDLTPILKDPSAFGIEGYDLLLKIMNPDTHLRWCSIDALSHSYLTVFRGYVSIDRTVIHGGAQKIYNQQVQYNEEEFRLRQMELKYLEIQHQTFIDLEIPMKQIRDIGETTSRMYYISINWIFETYLLEKHNEFNKGIDSFITTLFFINDNWESITKRADLQKLAILSCYIPDCIYSYNVTEIKHYKSICANCYKEDKLISFVLDQFIKKNNCKMPIYPVSIHIQYIYLKLKFELKDKRINTGEEVLKKLYIDMCLHLIFWFIQTKQFTSPVSLWEITIFSTNMALSNILSISVSALNRQPLLNFLTLDDDKFINMLQYFKSSLLNPDALTPNIPELHKYFYKNETFHCRYE
jgi:serine/threonine protein kinase